MKKLLLIAAITLMAVSCTTTLKTARTENVPYSMFNATVADLEVAPERISYTLRPSLELQKGGLANCKEAAIMEALEAYGDADLLLEPQFVISTTKTLLTSRIASITVTGRPAKYVNFRSLNDSVWCDPIFRADRNTGMVVSKKKGFLFWKK